MDIDKNYILVVLGIAAIVVEVLMGAATGFDLLLLGVIFVISGGLGLLLNSFVAALISITVLSLVYVFVARGFIKSRLHIGTKNTNVDAIIGKTGIVTKKISSNEAGQVKVNGETWRAHASRDIEPGTNVVIHSVSGVTLTVS